MQFRRARWVMMVLLSMLRTSTSFGLQAQGITVVERMKELNLPTLSGKVPAYFVGGYRDRAEMLQRRIEECNAYFEQRLGVHAEVTLAVLNADGWRAVTGEPYGLPHVRGRPAVIVMPATSGSPAFQLMNARRKDIPEDLLQAFLVPQRTTFEAIADQFVDLIGFHELGHILTVNYGIDPPNKWLGEFLASYWSYAYISERQPDWKTVFDLLGRPSAVRPKNTSLEDFERLYSRVDDCGWYQGNFEARIRELYPTRGLNFLTDMKREFPRTMSTGATQAIPPQQVLERLEKIAPGFQAWSARFSAGTG